MSISNLTALIIESRDDLLVTHGGPSKDGKFMGWITLPDEQYCRPLLNSEAVFDSPEDAENHMRDLMAKIRDQATSDNAPKEA